MCWINFHNGIWGCGFLCARIITLYFVSILCLSFRLPRRGLSRPFLTTTGYHACVYIPSRLPHQSYHAQPIHVHRVITPAISYSYFVVLSFSGFYATCASPPTPPLGATRHNLLNTAHDDEQRQQLQQQQQYSKTQSSSSSTPYV